MIKNVKALACAAALLMISNAHATGYFSSVPKNTVLRSGDFIANGNYCVIQQGDSNLVVYNRPQTNSCTGGKVIWASYSFNATYTVIQGDGNLVQYDDAGNAKWNSKTGGHPEGNYTFDISQYNGQLSVTLWNDAHTAGQEIWMSTADPKPDPVTGPTNPTPPSTNVCPGGVKPQLYTVCLSPGFMSQTTYRFPACSSQQAQLIALQNSWGWGACN